MCNEARSQTSSLCALQDILDSIAHKCEEVNKPIQHYSSPTNEIKMNLQQSFYRAKDCKLGILTGSFMSLITICGYEISGTDFQ